MEWQHPQALYLILPLSAAWLVLSIYSNRRRRIARTTFAATSMWSRILPEESSLRFSLKLALRELALIFGLLALAGPRWGMQYEQVVPRGSDLYVLIDVSRSMLADDVIPSRLGRAKADVSSLVNRLEGERVGLIAFAGQAVVKCPLTVDYDSFRRALEELDPDSAPRGGTAIGDAIRKAIEVFHAKSDRDQAVLLITDGDDQQSYPLEAAAFAAERHVTIFTVGLGDNERGARVPQKGNSGNYTEFEGQQVWSKLDNDLLQQIALKTNGVYVPAGTRAYDLGELYANYLQGRRGSDSTSQQRIRRSERFQIFLSIALLSLLIDLCVGIYRTPSNRKESSIAESFPKQKVVFKKKTAASHPRESSAHREVSSLNQSQSAQKNRSAFEDLISRRNRWLHHGWLHRSFIDNQEFIIDRAGRGTNRRSLFREIHFAERARVLFGQQFLKGIEHSCRILPMFHWPEKIAVFVRVAMKSWILAGVFNATALAAEPSVIVQDGLKLYASEKYDEAREKFAAANQELEKQKSAAAAIAAFNEACAYHRKGDLEHARDNYLKAGLSLDLSIATASHFNLGTLSAEKARSLSGEKPEAVPADKRQEILDQLTQAVAAYRHCLELNRNHAQSRKNLELVRQWIKFYTDRWREQDRQRRREESNLLQFLEYLTQTQSGLRETVTRLPEDTHADAFAELKRAQEELAEEIPILREKIESELRPPQDSNSPHPPPNQNELNEGIVLLKGFADTAGQKMSAAARLLGVRKSDGVLNEQKAAIEELDKIWEAVVPFQPLLAKELADQTFISRVLQPNIEQATNQENPQNEQIDLKNQTDSEADAEPSAKRGSQIERKEDVSQMEITTGDASDLEKRQSLTLRRAQLLAPKAAAELQQLESASTPPNATDDKQRQDTPAEAAKEQVDPEQVKEGFRKAIELAPKAIEQMEAAIQSLQKKDRQSAGQRAEEARKILEEIQQAQPKNNQKQDQQNNDEKQQEQNDKQGGDQNKDEPQKDDDKKDDDKKNESQKSDDQKKQDQKKPQQVSHDQIEEALRKVRERQQDKRERDKKFKGQYLGKTPVDKDW